MVEISWVAFFTLATMLLIIVSAEPLYRVQLYLTGLDLIKWAQTNLTSLTLKWFSISVSFIGGPFITGALVFVSYLFYSRKRAFYYITSFFIALFLSAIAKLYYQQARPFWLDDDIQAFDCGNDFGSPSGHSIIAMHVTFLYILDTMSSYGIDNLLVQSVLVI